MPDTLSATDPPALARHLIPAADGGHAALHCLEAAAGAARADVLMLPGMFTDRTFWLSQRGIGLAAHLAAAGLRCWLFERRGIGAAASAPQAARLGMQEALHQDLPAVWRFLDTRSTLPRFLIGHSFGGVLAARALANTLPQEDCAGAVLFATQCEVGKAPLHPPASWLTTALIRLLGRLPARLAGLGPVDEPAAAAIDAIAWTSAAQRDGRWLEELRHIHVPVIGIASHGDTVDPASGCETFLARFSSSDRSWTLLGEATGWAEDYSHAGMVVSRNARDEVWPHVRDWLLHRL